MLNALSPTEIYRLESRRFVLWLPVCLGVGIWAYFALPTEPSPWLCALVLVPALALLAGVRRLGWGALALAWAMAATGTGFGAALWSAHRAAAPVIAYPMGETVEGRVLALSRSASGKPRMLLDRVTVYGLEPERTPVRVRLTVLDPFPSSLPVPGQRVRVYASLMPTGEPVEPGAFNFNRRAFFSRLGGVGLTRGYLIVLPPEAQVSPWDRARIALARTRDALSRYLRQTIPGAEGAFAAAIIVGDRIDISDEDAEALRASNLAHLLAISGLHMGILTGLVFAVARLLLALLPATAYGMSTKKGAAIVALAAGAGYLALSGATVATQRAFVMVAVAFLAILCNRPALTLRALAVAATLILLVRPISLLDAGFQMSFAATAALVAGYEEMRERRHRVASDHSGWSMAIARGVVVYVAALLLSSLLAGTATAPIAAYHFNRTAPYGLLANLLAVPVMGFWIAPTACIAAVLAPFGLAEPVLRLMGAGIGHVLDVAHWVGAMPGAVQPVGAAPPIVLGIVALGGLWLMLWRGPWRFAGIAAITGGMVIWTLAPPRPDVLIAPEARLVGIMGPAGRVLDHDTAQSFAAKSWLRRDGDGAEQAVAAARSGLDRGQGWLSAKLRGDWQFRMRWDREPDPADLKAACRPRTVLVARYGPVVSGPCLYFGKVDLDRTGALALTVRPDGMQVKAARNPKRRRIWDRKP